MRSRLLHGSDETEIASGIELTSQSAYSLLSFALYLFQEKEMQCLLTQWYIISSKGFFSPKNSKSKENKGICFKEKE